MMGKLDTPMATPSDAEELIRLRTENAALKASVQTPAHGEEVYVGEDERGNHRYRIKIDLPPSGGQDIKLNGTSFYHGMEYDLRIETIRSMKEIMFRAWQQEQLIHGSNENFYRRERADRV